MAQAEHAERFKQARDDFDARVATLVRLNDANASIAKHKFESDMEAAQEQTEQQLALVSAQNDQRLLEVASKYQGEIVDLKRSSADTLKRALSDAAVRIKQVQDEAQHQIATIEAQAAAELQITELQAAASREDAIEKIRAHAADVHNIAQSQAAAEVARVRCELAEALDTLDQRDADAAQVERMAQTRVVNIEEEAVQWKQSAEESFSATLTAYRDKMEAKVVEMEQQLVLAREEAQYNAESAEVARCKVQNLEHAERRAVRKVRCTISNYVDSCNLHRIFSLALHA